MKKNTFIAVFMMAIMAMFGVEIASAASYIPPVATIDTAVSEFTVDTGTLVTKMTPLMILITGSLAGFALFKRFFRTSLK